MTTETPPTSPNKTPLKITAKIVGRWILIGALLGAFLFSWFSPQLIAWYFAPPVEIAMTCRGAVEWGLNMYRKFLIGGLAIGAFSGLIFLLMVQKRQSRRALLIVNKS